MSAPRVGIGVFAFKRDGTFILGKRKGSLGSGTYALPGGHLEYGETFSECAARELYEETDIKVAENELHYLTTVNTVFEQEGLQYVTVAMGCIIANDIEPKLVEPDRCEGWQFVSWEQLCGYAEQDLQAEEGEYKTLFKPMLEFVKQRGFNPQEALVGQQKM